MKESRIPSTPSTPLSANNDVLFFHRARMFTQPALRVSWPQALRTSNKTPASAGAGRTASFPTGRGGAHPRVVLSALRALHQTARQAGVGRTAGFPADRGGANWRRVLLGALRPNRPSGLFFLSCYAADDSAVYNISLDDAILICPFCCASRRPVDGVGYGTKDAGNVLQEAITQ